MTTPTAAVLRTELKLFRREPGAIFWIVAFPTLLVAILGFVPDMRKVDDDLGYSPLTLYVPIAILLAMIMSAVSAMPVIMATYREHHVLRRIATTPARPRDLLIAQYVIYGGAAVLGSVLTILLGRFAFDIGLPRNVVGFVLVLVLMLLACLAIGGVIAGSSPSGKIATTIGTVLLFPLMFTAGVWLPVQVMPGMLGDIVALTPLGAGSLALETTSSGDWPSLKDLAVIVAWTLGLSAIASRFFRWE